jgi:replicative DNA helicase
MDIAVVAMAQLNRGVEGRDNRRPGLSDLRDSGSLEQDATNIIFAYRPAYYLEKPEDNEADETFRLAELEKCRNKLELIIAKNRNGPLTTVKCFIDIGANAIRDFRGNV